jgi:uncharacterized phiE125 gp8 family phage protein
MIVGDRIALPPEAAAAVKDYLRVERPEEDALILSLAAGAAELCEAFTGQALLARGFTQTLAARTAWQRLGRTPVRSISGIEALPPGAEPVPLAPAAYALDVDSNGDGWVRVAVPGEARIRVAFQAGLAAEWSGLPEALRQGVVRLAAHFYVHRTGEPGRAEREPPAAVTALWRPWRRMRLA